MEPSVESKYRYEERLYGVYDEYKDERLLVHDAIEDEHGLDCKMPRTCSVWSGHDDCYGTHGEGDKCADKSQVARGVEAEKREIEVEKITYPNAESKEKKEGNILDMA